MSRKHVVEVLLVTLAAIGGVSLGFLCYLGLLVLFDADFRSMTQPALISLLGGGFVGALVTLVSNRLTLLQNLRVRQMTTIHSLERELEQIHRLCTYNKNLERDEIAPFIRFPNLVLNNVAFKERQDFPMLESHQRYLQSVAMGASQVNQLISQHEAMWGISEQPNYRPGKQYRGELRTKISEICAGTKAHEGSDINFPDSVENALNAVRTFVKTKGEL